MTFPLQRTIFAFLVLVYDRVGDRDKFLCENFSLGRPRFHATCHFFLVLVYDRVGDRDKFLCENFSLGRPRFHATCHLKIEANKLKLIHEYQRIATTAFLKSRIVTQFFFL